MLGGETAGVGDGVDGSGLPDPCVAGLTETGDIGLAEVCATGVAPQPARTNATMNAAAAAPSIDLMPV